MGEEAARKSRGQPLCSSTGADLLTLRSGSPERDMAILHQVGGLQKLDRRGQSHHMHLLCIRHCRRFVSPNQPEENVNGLDLLEDFWAGRIIGKDKAQVGQTIRCKDHRQLRKAAAQKRRSSSTLKRRKPSSSQASSSAIEPSSKGKRRTSSSSRTGKKRKVDLKGKGRAIPGDEDEFEVYVEVPLASPEAAREATPTLAFRDFGEDEGGSASGSSSRSPSIIDVDEWPSDPDDDSDVEILHPPPPEPLFLDNEQNALPFGSEEGDDRLEDSKEAEEVEEVGSVSDGKEEGQADLGLAIRPPCESILCFAQA